MTGAVSDRVWLRTREPNCNKTPYPRDFQAYQAV